MYRHTGAQSMTCQMFWLLPSLGSETATSGALLLLPFFGALEKGEGADGPAGPHWMISDRQVLTELKGVWHPQIHWFTGFSLLVSTGPYVEKMEYCIQFVSRNTQYWWLNHPEVMEQKKIRQRNRPAPSISYAASTCIAR